MKGRLPSLRRGRPSIIAILICTTLILTLSAFVTAGDLPQGFVYEDHSFLFIEKLDPDQQADFYKGGFDIAKRYADGFGDACDNCPGTYNTGQVDSDFDGAGDLCDICPGFDDFSDIDIDGIPDGCDNCPDEYNPLQIDEDENGTGDICDYICGDSNGDEGINLGDASFIINYIFYDGPESDPLCAGDCNGDETTNLADASYIINYIFYDGLPPLEDCCP